VSDPLSPDQIAWIDRARDAAILEVALRSPLSAKLKKHSREHVGPCPACGGDDRFAVNPKKKGGIFNCRGFGGGDVIAMVMHVCRVRFLDACEIINGEPMPGADSKVSREDLQRQAEERQREHAARQAQLEAEENAYRERERSIAHDIWTRAEKATAGTPVEACLKLRGIPTLPIGLKLRYAPDLPYFGSDQKGTDPLHRGPAYIAGITRPDGRFGGIHRTWIDLSQPKGKLRLLDKDGAVLDARKARGSTRGGRIELVGPPDPARLVIGEGIEKTLAVWYALHARGDDLIATSFWTSINLDNIGGAADRTKRARGPCPSPDLSKPGIPIPDSVEKIIILGDSTSDRLTTRCAIARAETRWRKPGRVILCAWSPDGQDFDDLLRAA
jgi:hypothetical protein